MGRAQCARVPTPKALLPYRWTSAAEPHFDRRRRLLAAHPEISQLMGWDPWPNLRMALVVALQFGLAAWMQNGADHGRWWGRFWWLLLVGYLAGGVANHYSGVIWHEASHNCVAPTTFWNRVAGIFANLPVVVPCAMSFRRYHMMHHTFMGIPGRDNDLPGKQEAQWVGNSWWKKILWLHLFTFFAIFNRGFWNKLDRWEVAGVVVQLSVDAATIFFLGWTAFGYLALSTWLATGPHPIAGHFIQEHYLWDANQETYSYYGILNKVTLNMGYHNEHHDFVNVPGKNLPRLHQIAREEYGSLVAHTSWTATYWEFITNQGLSHWSRFARTLEVLQKTRRQALAGDRRRIESERGGQRIAA